MCFGPLAKRPSFLPPDPLDTALRGAVFDDDTSDEAPPAPAPRETAAVRTEESAHKQRGLRRGRSATGGDLGASGSGLNIRMRR